MRPRIGHDDDHYGRRNYNTQEERPVEKLTFKKPGENSPTEYIETRFDNRKDGVTFRKPMRKRDGDYDPNAKYSQRKQVEFKKTYVDLTKPVRLNKFLANAGICSRREADEYIQAGVISVNGEVVSELGVKVKMQGRIQKWVDHSISVTINLPNNVSEDLVNQLYVEAWRSGCKGCTVYRDGSRAGVLISTKKKDKKEEEEECRCKPPQVVEVRPKVLEADVVRFQNNKEKWVAFVGLLDGRPYEIFTGLQDDEEGIVLPKSVTSGRIIKSYDEDGTKHYDFQFENKRGYKMTIEGLSEKFNKEYWNYAKLISGVLRWRMPIEQVIKLVGSLQLDSENINTWKNGVERALKKYVQDGTEAKGVKCPNCGHETLVYQEGCLICKTCGSSRCG
jgi:ribonucleotide reductase alpha subunit